MIPRISGYTLLELLVTLSLFTLVSFMAVPLWLDWLELAGTVTQVNQLTGAINYARSEAIKRSATISICQSIDGDACSGSWSDGYVVFINKGKSGEIPGKRDNLRFYSPLSSRGRLIWRGKGMFSVNPFGSFLATNSIFSYCPDSKDIRFAREIIISVTGRIRVTSQLTWPCL